MDAVLDDSTTVPLAACPPGADRSFRFGVELSQPLPGCDWVESARELERLGYGTVFVVDHLHEGPGPLAALGAMAVATDTIRLGTLVLGVDFRNPAFLARELATIDVMSGGRLEVGLGAGYNTRDYLGAGLPKDTGRVRFERLTEYVTILRGLWSDGPFSFRGNHFTIDDVDRTGVPTQAGGPPLLIGAGGPAMLEFAGANADIVGVTGQVRSGTIDLDAARDVLADRIDDKITAVNRGAGNRSVPPELNTLVPVAVVTDDADLAAGLAPAFGANLDEFHASPATLVGTLDVCEGRLVARRQRWGFSYVVLSASAAIDFAPLVRDLTGT